MTIYKVVQENNRFSANNSKIWSKSGITPLLTQFPGNTISVFSILKKYVLQQRLLMVADYTVYKNVQTICHNLIKVEHAKLVYLLTFFFLLTLDVVCILSQNRNNFTLEVLSYVHFFVTNFFSLLKALHCLE